MKNLLSSLSSKVAKEIIKKKYQDSLPDFKDESEKIKNLKAREKYKEALNNAKEDMKKRGEDMLDPMNENLGGAVRQIESDINELGIDLGHLTIGTAMFSSRVAMVPPALISVTPMGPGVSAQLAPPLIQQLKAEGDNLSAVYDRVDTKVNKLGLKSMIGSVPGVSEIMGIVNTTQSVAKPFIALVGADVGDLAGNIPTPELPIPVPELDAVTCSKFSPKDLDISNITASNCENFDPLNSEDKSIKCSNCKNYKSKS